MISSVPPLAAAARTVRNARSMRRRLWSATAPGVALAVLAVLAILVAPGAGASDVYDGEAYTL